MGPWVKTILAATTWSIKHSTQIIQRPLQRPSLVLLNKVLKLDKQECFGWDVTLAYSFIVFTAGSVLQVTMTTRQICSVWTKTHSLEIQTRDPVKVMMTHILWHPLLFLQWLSHNFRKQAQLVWTPNDYTLHTTICHYVPLPPERTENAFSMVQRELLSR